MARFGSEEIRGHGIPEAMEQVLLNESRIPARLTWLKPLSAAIAIGTGGPFGAEGPIIATGGALGSLLGQRVRVTADERKTLLAAGAAAGMAATFGIARRGRAARGRAAALRVAAARRSSRSRSRAQSPARCASLMLGSEPVLRDARDRRGGRRRDRGLRRSSAPSRDSLPSA